MAAPIVSRRRRRIQVHDITLPGGYTGVVRDGSAHQEIEKLKELIEQGGGSGGVSDYALLTNRPAINSHTLNGGENSLSSIGLGLASSSDINNLFD